MDSFPARRPENASTEVGGNGPGTCRPALPKKNLTKRRLGQKSRKAIISRYVSICCRRPRNLLVHRGVWSIRPGGRTSPDPSLGGGPCEDGPSIIRDERPSPVKSLSAAALGRNAPRGRSRETRRYRVDCSVPAWYRTGPILGRGVSIGGERVHRDGPFY